MAQHPAQRAVGVVTALPHHDHEAFISATAEFARPEEAVAALGHLTVAILNLAAEMVEPPMTREQLWELMAQAITSVPEPWY
jgi:hypothetical protein